MPTLQQIKQGQQNKEWKIRIDKRVTTAQLRQAGGILPQQLWFWKIPCAKRIKQAAFTTLHQHHIPENFLVCLAHVVR